MRNWRMFLSLVVASVLFLAAAGCGQNVARSWGGVITVQVQPGKKVVSASWKGGDLWILVRPMRGDEQPETFEYYEKSNYGMVEGKVVLEESR